MPSALSSASELVTHTATPVYACVYDAGKYDMRVNENRKVPVVTDPVRCSCAPYGSDRAMFLRDTFMSMQWGTSVCCSAVDCCSQIILHPWASMQRVSTYVLSTSAGR